MDRFPEIEPYDHGMLAVGDEQEIYWETCGNPAGKPAVVLHGGPGSGCTLNMRRNFDPETYRIVLFDQRGAGRSTPRVKAQTDLSVNTTHHLIEDMERLRRHLGIERWLIWGRLVGRDPRARLRRAVSPAGHRDGTGVGDDDAPADVHWLYHETGRFFPEEWERFRNGVPEDERDGDLVAAYYSLLNVNPDITVREKAAQDWCGWEDAVQSLEEGWSPSPRYADPAFRMTFARIVTHYFHHHAWLADGQLLQNASRLAGIPRRPHPWPFRPRRAGRYRLAAGAGLARRRAAPREHRPQRWWRNDRQDARGHRPLRSVTRLVKCPNSL